MHFTARLATANDAGGRWVACPFDSREVFGQARPRVVGTVNGHPFRTRLAVYGGVTYLGFAAEVRTRAGIDVDSTLDIEIGPDDKPPEIDLPDALAAALRDNPGARAAYEALSFTNRKEYAGWVSSAKREDTRRRRVTRALEMLVEGIRHP